MIEKVVFDYLKSELTPVPVYMEIPSNPPTDFALIEKTGSSQSELLYTSTIAIQSYSDTLFRSVELNELVKTVMSGLTEDIHVTCCRLDGDYNFTDPTTKKYRYQAVFKVSHY